MTSARRQRYDLAWRRRNVVALLVLCVPTAAGLVGRAGLSSPWPGCDSHEHDRRINAAAEKINPNTAGLASLRRLPNVGPAKARAVIDYRTAHPDQPFGRPEDLARVPGIGPGIVREAVPLLTFEGPR